MVEARLLGNDSGMTESIRIGFGRVHRLTIATKYTVDSSLVLWKYCICTSTKWSVRGFVEFSESLELQERLEIDSGKSKMSVV